MAAPDIIELLNLAVQAGASDLHISSDVPPVGRVHGELLALSETPLTSADCREMLLSLLTDTQRARLEEEWELNFAVQVDGVGRFRGNAHYNRGALESAFRHIPSQIPDLGSLGHSASVFRLCGLSAGLVLVTGATGSGKSTTIASMIKHISENQAGVIITAEDPIEFVIPNGRSIVKQREIGSDTHSFSQAVVNAMRQDPDIIVVGEMRDSETIGAAITAAETGHLVLGTLHTIDAPKAIDRIVDVFPSDQQPQVIAQLANSLEAVVCQRLLPREDGAGRVLASEILVANSAVRACIRERRWEQIVGLIEIGARDGMQTFDEHLALLYRERLISKEEALANARDKDRFESLTRGGAERRLL